MFDGTCSVPVYHEADKFDSRSVIPTESVRLHDDAKVQPVVHPNLFSQFPCNLRELPLD